MLSPGSGAAPSPVSEIQQGSERADPRQLGWVASLTGQAATALPGDTARSWPWTSRSSSSSPRCGWPLPGRTEAWRSHAAKYLCQWALPISSVGTLFSCIGPGMMGGRECGRWDEHGELLPAGSGELAERGYRATSERTYGWETSAHGRLSGESAMGRGCQAVQRRAFFTFGTKS